MQKIIQSQQNAYRNLFVHHNAIKAINFKKKADSNDKLRENLILQYAIKDYIELIMKRVRHGQELSKDEIAFLSASEKVFEGKKLSTSDMVKIRDFILHRHSTDIKGLRECDYTLVIQELNSYGEGT